MPELRTLMSGLVVGESPRWHEGRLWFSNWGAQEIIAVSAEGSSEVMTRVATSIPFSIDWLPDGRLLVVSARDGRLYRREPDGSLLVTDVNPRFGGGFPLPLAAGGRYPELALALARGEHPEPRLGDFREGIVMTRFFSDLSLMQNGDGTLKPLAPAE